MKKRPSNIIIILLACVTLFGGGLAQAYLAPDYSNPVLAPGGATPYVIGPGVLADYLTNPNWAFTPPLRKFIDPLPGLCNPATTNCTGGKKIPIAIPDIVTYPGSDYYVIELRQYSEQMHSDLANPTTLRGYVQKNSGTDTSGGCKDPAINPADPLNCTPANNTITPAGIHFLGPVIIAQKDRPVRVLFKNKINPAVDGDLFLPVDTTIMGSGAYDINYNPVTKENTGLISGMFSTNRATLHLHGGRSPWISDGTPHQWITPAGEDPNYPQGVSVENVPDMDIPVLDSGEQTFYWTNQQSSRFMFYHDHAWGITRLNVYAGEAAGYLIRDNVEQNLTDTGIIPGFKSDGSVSMGGEVPLVLMDKTFVDANTIEATDPTWNWGTGATVATGVVTFVDIIDGGSGYTNVPAVTITEGGNTSASATAVLTSVVSSITVDPLNKGLGYVAPLVVIDDPVGVGATAEATINGAGAITGITVTNGGSGYDVLSPPTVTIFDQNNDEYTPAVATAAVSATVTSIAVSNGGSGYINPVVTIDPPVAGTQATATATVTDIKALKTGDLWWPHVYMPAQNPYDVSGIAPMGRWAYGPYFYPATNNLYQPVPNPYYSPLCDPLVADNNTPGFLNGFCQAPENPGTPNPSWGAEAFMDTAMVNGTAYPYVDLEPKAYRLRILNAAHDRFMNLSMYIADTLNPNTDPLSSALCSSMGGCAVNTEIPWVPAADPLPWVGDPAAPATWPIDGRPGGVPDWTKRGPDWIMIGNEGGFLPMPVTIQPHPVTWNINPSMFNVGNVNGGSLILGPAERADVIVDFSDPKYYGKTLIVYNDAPAPWPAINPQYDFYTGNPDGMEYGSAPSTLPGFGPNTRTIMQIRICNPGAGCTAGTAFDLAKLQDAFDPTRSDQGIAGPGVFQQSQDPIVAAQGNMNPNSDPLLYETFLGTQDYSAYSRAYGTEGSPAVFPTIYPNWGVSRINDSIIKFKTLNPDGSLNPTVQSIAMKRKSIHDEMGATFDDYGRMRAALGLEMANGGPLQVNFIVQTYSSPVTENLVPGGVQVWKITHNGVDTHPIHFHLFDVQVLNRVGWDGFIRLPDPAELGWKETVRISPLEDTIVALRPVTPALPFGVPTSYRPLNPATPLGSTTELTQIDPVTGNPRVTTNDWKNFEWEYVWHCHILSHEENDMMRAMSFNVAETVPIAPVLSAAAACTQSNLSWTDATPLSDPAIFGNLSNEIGFRAERCTGAGCSNFATIGAAQANSTSFADNSIAAGVTYQYRVVAYNAAGESMSNTVSVTAPIVCVSPAVLTFPNQLLNTTSGVYTATLFNAGASPLTINSITIGGTNPGDFAVAGSSTCGGSLAAASNCTIDLTFTPTAVGARSASVNISNSDLVNPTLTVTLNGTGIAGPIAGVSPSTFTFTDQLVNTTSAAQTVTLSNTGNAPLTINSITIGGTNPGDFAVAGSSTCGASLAAASNCAIDLTFTPTAMGASSASVNISSSDPVNPTLTVTLNGTGIAPIAGILPASLTFANQLVNTISVPQTVTLSNTGTAPLIINSIIIGGTNPGDFAVAGSSTCGASLAAASNCAIDLTFTPTAMGASSASVNISSSDPVNPTLTVTLNGTGIAPVAAVSPTSLTLSSKLNVTSAAKAVILSNTGTAPLIINSIALGGTNPSQFAQTYNCPIGGAGLAAGGRCTINVTFRPTSVGTGTTSASLNVNVAAPATSKTVSLTGTVLAPVLSLSPTSLSFGTVTRGTSSAYQNVTVKNTGSELLTIKSIIISGAYSSQFTQASNCSTSLAAGASCTVSVRFRPAAGTTIGLKSASLNVYVAAPATSKSVSLSGTAK